VVATHDAHEVFVEQLLDRESIGDGDVADDREVDVAAAELLKGRIARAVRARASAIAPPRTERDVILLVELYCVADGRDNDGPRCKQRPTTTRQVPLLPRRHKNGGFDLSISLARQRTEWDI